MPSLEEAVRDFLACRRIAVAGVSRERNKAANGIYLKLRANGHSVFATNPRAERIEGDPCYPNLRSIPDEIEAVVIAAPPAAALAIVQECRDLGIRRVWMHRGIGSGSVSSEAVRFCHESGITVIPGACPMMFCRNADVAHRCARTVLGWFGRLPAVD